MNTQRTTIDLNFGTEWVTDRLLKCEIREDIHQESDHLPIATEISMRTRSIPPARRRLWKETDLILLRATISRLLPNDISLNTIEEIETYAENIQKAIQKAINMAVPWARPSNIAKDFWTTQCTAAVQQARRRRQKWQKQASIESWKLYLDAINTKANIIKKARKAFFRTQIHELSQNPKAILKLAKWARTKSHLPKEAPQFPPLKRIRNAGEATEFGEKVEILREKFFPPTTTSRPKRYQRVYISATYP